MKNDAKATTLHLARSVGDERYGDVIDVAHELGRGNYGSASNAAAVMIRQSELFRSTRDRLKREAEQAATTEEDRA